MVNLSNKANNLKKFYREIFINTNAGIKEKVEKLKPKDACINCKQNCGKNIDVFENFPNDCVYKIWQKNVRNFLEGELSKIVYSNWMKIIEERKKYECLGCGTCCKLAVSEFSYEELKLKAKNGDNFANQFISVFVPYQTEAEARAIFPEYFEMLEKSLGDGENVYFYHCPKVTKDNRCSDYENRPQICRDFPDNPLGFLPTPCGFQAWKNAVEPTALSIHALVEIIDYYKEKIPE